MLLLSSVPRVRVATTCSIVSLSLLDMFDADASCRLDFDRLVGLQSDILNTSQYSYETCARSLCIWMAPQAAEIRRELSEGAGAVVENSPLPLPDDVVRCAGAALEGELSELELVRRIRREAPPPPTVPPSEEAAARGGATARESLDEELVRACRDSKLVERQKELLTGALEAKVWRALFRLECRPFLDRRSLCSLFVRESRAVSHANPCKWNWTRAAACSRTIRW